MIEIPLSRGKVARIDDEDAALVAGFKWWAHQGNDGHGWYARGYPLNSPTNRSQIMMHNLILGVHAGTLVDHLDGDGLNNTRANLRPATRAQNAQNQHIRSDNQTGFKGVGRSQRHGRLYPRWRAKITIEGRTLHLGYFASPAQAAEAYDEAARRHFGRFARVNFPRASEAGACAATHRTKREKER